MKIFLKLKSWQLFLLFLVPGYSMTIIPFIVNIGFFVIIYSLWIYSIAKCCERKVKELRVIKLSSTFFNLSCLFLPVFWVLSVYYSVYDVNTAFYFSILLYIVFGEMIYFTSRRLLASIGINLMWIIIGLLIPFIGVWYIQPKINSIYNSNIALEMEESLK